MTKDWTGNKTTNFATIGASNYSIHEREKHDYYATDPEAIDRLNKVFKIPHDLYECCCGAGHLSKRLIELGFNVYSTDLINRGYGDKVGIDFLKVKSIKSCYSILTNPPYRYAAEFVKHSLNLLEPGKQAIFFLRIQFLETAQRYDEIFINKQLKYVYVAKKRVLCGMNGEFSNNEGKKLSSATCFAWFIFEKGYNDEPIIKWF